jgi:hypothetical protein
VIISNNYVTALGKPVKFDSGADGWRHEACSYQGNASDADPVDVAVGALRSVEPKQVREPLLLSDLAASIVWPAGSHPLATVTLTTNAARTMGAPTGLQNGLTYHLSIAKTSAGGTIGTWNAAFAFGAAGQHNAAPAIAGMAVGQVWTGAFTCDGTKLRCVSSSIT